MRPKSEFNKLITHNDKYCDDRSSAVNAEASQSTGNGSNPYKNYKSTPETTEGFNYTFIEDTKTGEVLMIAKQ